MVGQLLLLLVLLSTAQLAWTISNGQPDSTNAFPMVCALLFGSPAVPGGWNVTCSAALVAPATLVTAAQCAGMFTHVSCRSSVNTTTAFYPVDKTESISQWWTGSNGSPAAAGSQTGSTAAAEDSLLIVTLKQPVFNARLPLLPKAVPASFNETYSLKQQSGPTGSAPGAGGECCLSHD